MPERKRVLLLWNQVEEDIYEKWREAGPQTLDWNPEREVPDVGTVAEEMEVMFRAIREAGFELIVVNVLDDIDRIISAIRLYRPDLVFNLVEYFNDDSLQEAWVAGLYDMLGQPFTGNPPLTLATCQNKFRTKLILEAAGLPTSPFFIAKKPNIPEHELEFPLIVKPAAEDASGGISKDSVVHDQEALERRIQHVWKEFEMPALIEEYIEGREIHAAVLGNPGEVLPLFEMEFDDSEFNPEGEWRPQIISFRAKWDPHSQDFYTMDAVCPAEDLEPELEDYIREVALGAYKALGCKDYARIDMRVDDEEGEVYILEVNPNPDLVDGAAYMMCATASGRTYAQTLGEILNAALDWYAARAKAAKVDLPSDHLLREFVSGKKIDAGAPGTTDILGQMASEWKAAGVASAALELLQAIKDNSKLQQGLLALAPLRLTSGWIEASALAAAASEPLPARNYYVVAEDGSNAWAVEVNSGALVRFRHSAQGLEQTRHDQNLRQFLAQRLAAVINGREDVPTAVRETAAFLQA